MNFLLALAVGCFVSGLTYLLRNPNKELKLTFALFDVGRALLSVRAALP